MLGRLFSSAGGHGRSPSTLESATEEQYTRNLLFSDTSTSSSLPSNVPTASKIGDFDNHNGFEVDEKDARLIIAQDAYADQERPSILFDSDSSKIHGSVPNTVQVSRHVPATRHERTGSGIAPAKPYFSPQPETSSASSQRSPTSAFQIRNRGATISPGQAGHVPSALRESESKDLTKDILECMFGASSSTKRGTRMHVIKPSKEKLPRIAFSSLVSPDALPERAVHKPVLKRAQTSGIPSESAGRGDIVLITRIFTVAPPDNDKGVLEHGPNTSVVISEDPSSPSEGIKPPKLREKKTLAFGVCLVIQLPRKRCSRPVSRHGDSRDQIYSSPPATSSFGSDLQSSWTFLEALPPSLSSSRLGGQPTVDSHIDFILHRWDMLGRHLSIMEAYSSEKIFALLSQIDDQSSGRKTPKEKRMQRINQKFIRLPPCSLADDQEIYENASRAIHFIRSALSIPAVRPLSGGHWLEEARLVTRLCSQKGHDRFFATLLTAFLGNHSEWIDEVGQALPERRLHSKSKSKPQNSALRSRTVIICEDRILARRLVFLLASFLFPGMLSLRSISDASAPRSSVRSQRHHILTSRDHPANLNISTSLSSTEDDLGGHYVSGNPRRRLQRNPSETSSLRTAHLSIPCQDSNFHKSSAGTTTTVTPNPSTPLAYMTPIPKDSDGYFSTVSSTKPPNSAAEASLQRLRRSSSTASSVPSTWGSLLGSIWTNKQTSSAGTSTTTIPSDTFVSTITSSHLSDRQALSINKLENMVQEAGIVDSLGADSHKSSLLSPREEKIDLPPQLEVDEKDGVIDVDLNLPNSLLHSYASSPDVLPAFTTPLSTSTASLDDARSFFSVGSSPRTLTGHANNIAGFLKAYHPDFALQAVRSCSETDVRTSMSLSSYAAAAGESGSFNYDESSTLIADASNYSIKRIMLRRNPRSSGGASQAEQDIDSSPSQDVFSLESIRSYDETLADALDRALDQPSAIPSRMPSPSPSKQRHFRTVSTGTTSTVNPSSPLATSYTPASVGESLQPLPVPQRNRGQLIVDALREVVGDVDRDLRKYETHRAENIPMVTKHGSAVAKPEKTEENALRDGVKRWLQGAEETSVW